MKHPPAGSLHLIPSPISDQGKKDFQADLLDMCQMLVCERIRTTRRLIKPLVDQQKFDEIKWIEIDKHDLATYDDVIAVLRTGGHVGLLSEAGMPCIADPGHRLVARAHEEGIPVRPYGGPNSFMMALAASGLPGQSFVFHGYLPRESGELRHALQQISLHIEKSGMTQICMETPYRNAKLFEAILRTMSDGCWLSISMDITGTNEWIQTMSVGQWKKKSPPFHEKGPAVFVMGRRDG